VNTARKRPQHLAKASIHCIETNKGTLTLPADLLRLFSFLVPFPRVQDVKAGCKQQMPPLHRHLLRPQASRLHETRIHARRCCSLLAAAACRFRAAASWSVRSGGRPACAATVRHTPTLASVSNVFLFANDSGLGGRRLGGSLSSTHEDRGQVWRADVWWKRSSTRQLTWTRARNLELFLLPPLIRNSAIAEACCERARNKQACPQAHTTHRAPALADYGFVTRLALPKGEMKAALL